MEQDNLPLGMVIGSMMRENTQSAKKLDIKQVEITLSIEQHAVLHILSNRESDVILKKNG